jgi:large subunit ribosomal protein L22
MRPAPQGRGYRVRKRSNHVTVIVDSLAPAKIASAPVAEVVEAAPVEAPAKTKAPAKKKINLKKED